MSVEEVRQLANRLNYLEIQVARLETSLKIASGGLAILGTIVAPVITALILVTMGVR